MEAKLEQIEMGNATAAEARAVVSKLLRDGSEASVSRLYDALGAWLWKALDGRRRDEELREWFDIFRRSSASITENHSAYSERFRAFYDLLEMSIATSMVADPTRVLSRQHVVQVLQILRRAGSRPVEKTIIAQTLGLGPENMSRVLHMMSNARLLERTTYGKKAFFAITREGAAALAKHEVVSPPRPDPPTLPPKNVENLIRAFVEQISESPVRRTAASTEREADKSSEGHARRLVSTGTQVMVRNDKRHYRGWMVLPPAQHKSSFIQDASTEDNHA
ncbi:MAG: hypothetical protein WDN02_02920 [Methylovirgula sp.]|uniref:hypothetical protein n=1 Tax=Methylovirgula sp. TaxID=1978224 RepID=UPI00307623A7